MSVDVAVIIVNFNAGEHLRAAVESAGADLLVYADRTMDTEELAAQLG